jgi:hypothetical protein
MYPVAVPNTQGQHFEPAALSFAPLFTLAQRAQRLSQQVPSLMQAAQQFAKNAQVAHRLLTEPVENPTPRQSRLLKKHGAKHVAVVVEALERRACEAERLLGMRRRRSTAQALPRLNLWAVLGSPTLKRLVALLELSLLWIEQPLNFRLPAEVSEPWRRVVRDHSLPPPPPLIKNPQILQHAP